MATLRTIAACCLLIASGAEAQTPSELETRTEFLRALNRALVYTDDGEPLALGGRLGWRGVVLTPPGTTLPSSASPFEAEGIEQINVPLLIENANTFDRVLLVKDGIGHSSAVSIADVWRAVLDRTRPTEVVEELAEDSEAAKWLFREADAVDKARGIRFIREPSPAMLRFREYESLYRVLSVAEQRDDGTWRLHPRLANYGSVVEAKEALAADWLTYGFKAEVSSALAVVNATGDTAAWRAWTDSDSRFTSGRVPTEFGHFIPRSVLFPSPSEWVGMIGWIRMSARTPDPDVRVAFQLAHVRVVRTWFTLEKLLDGHLVLPQVRIASRLPLSDGVPPTTVAYPQGALAVFPEELVLVRNIRFVNSNGPVQSLSALADRHPLARYAYPDAINLLAYVVRALPELAK